MASPSLRRLLISSLLQVRKKFQKSRIHLGRFLLLRPMSRSLYQHGPAQVRHPRLHASRHLRPQHDVALRGDHQGRLLDAIFAARAFLPASIDASIPVETAAKSSLLERAQEDVEVFIGEKFAVRTIRESCQQSATR